MLFPALVTASSDERLRGAPLGVYLWLVCHQLDLQEYRRLKVQGIAAAMKVKSDTASRALRILVAGGYVERKYVSREGYAYRLRLTRAA